MRLLICALRHMSSSSLPALWADQESGSEVLHVGTSDQARNRNRLETARDDAEGGLGIAQNCGFSHLVAIGLTLLADICEHLGDKYQAGCYRKDARAICG